MNGIMNGKELFDTIREIDLNGVIISIALTQTEITALAVTEY